MLPIKTILNNKKLVYTTISASLLIWMTFFDTENFLQNYKMLKKLNTLQNTKSFYTEQIKTITIEIQNLNGDIQSIEKFAREKYLMKTKSEDLYIIKKISQQ